MCEATSQCCNVQLDSDSWTQAYLLLRFGSLGIRWLVGVALPTYIASLEVSWDLVCIINHPVPQRQTGPPWLPSRDIHQQPMHILHHQAGPNIMDSRQGRPQAPPGQLDCLCQPGWLCPLPGPCSPSVGPGFQPSPMESLSLLLPDEAVRGNVTRSLGWHVRQSHCCC